MNPAAVGVLLLILDTLIWGTTFVVTKKTLESFPSATLVFGRFLIAAILFSPFLRLGKKLWRAAVELGIFLWLGFATQTIGLRYTTVNRSAFITALNVIFVPILTAAFGEKIPWIIWLAAGMALGGVALLCNDGSPPNIGDAWTLACAAAWGLYIFRLEHFTRHLPSRPLTAAHLWVVMLLSAIWALPGFSGHSGPAWSSVPWKSVIYLGVMATAITTWVQTYAQKSVSAPRAAVLYTLEPVWASLFGWWILGELPGALGWTGAAIIIIAAILAQLRG